MKLARLSLWIAVLAFAFFGVLLISAPRTFEKVGMLLLTRTDRI